MPVSKRELFKKLDSLSFNSLDKLGINWRSVIKASPELELEYLKYLSLRQN